MTQVREPEEAPAGTGAARWPPDAPTVVFVLGLILAFVTILWWARGQWFFLDEWDFLADRRLTSLDDLMRPHNEHWSTLPIIAYRTLYAAFGINTYGPYLATVVVSHLGIAAMLWVISRRAGVNGWIATLVVLPFVFLGTGDQNITWAFQIGFNGAVLFGLVYFVLVDHDGPWSRRDWAGLLFGLASLMCAGIGVVMVAGVALAVLLRRGLRPALAHLVPLGGTFLVWYGVVGRHHASQGEASLGLVREFVWNGARDALEQYSQSRLVGGVVGILVLVGLVLVARDRADLRRIATPLSVAATAIMMLAVTGWGRAGFGAASASRYVHIVIALLTPALAVIAQRFWTHSHLVGGAFVALLLVGMPGNIDAFGDGRNPAGPRRLVSSLPAVSEFAEVPGDTRPVGDSPELTVGWLREATDDGRVPARTDLTEREVERARFALLLDQRASAPTHECMTIPGELDVTIEPGRPIGFTGKITVIPRDEGLRAAPKTFDHLWGNGLRATIRPVSVTIRPRDFFASVCLP